MAGSFQIRSLEFSIGELPEVGFVGVVVVRLQVAKHGRHRVCAVIGNGYGLGVAQFRKGLHIEAIISVGVPGELLSRATKGHVTLLLPKRPANAPLCLSSQCH
jgi:hypothetical protein